MNHVLLLLYTLTFAAGAASMSVVYFSYREGRTGLFRDYLRFLLLLNVCVAVNLAATYVENVLTEVSPFPPAGGLPVLVDLTGMFLVGGIVNSFSRVMWAAVGSETRRSVGFIILGLLLLGSAATVLFALLDPEATRSSLHVVPRTVNLVLIAGAAAAAFRTLAVSRGLEGRRRTTVRWFAVFHLLAFITVVAGFFIPPTVAWHLLAASFLCINLAPLALVRSLRAERATGPGLADAVTRNLGTFAAEYGMSAREMEILSQVITGKTNIEMAEALFISASTVKNHIHNIYQKCGARNRVELVRLINDAGTTELT